MRLNHFYFRLLYWTMLGFGSGRFPKMPGTAGTAFAIPIYYYLSALPRPFYLMLSLLFTALGIWGCGICAHHVGKKDPPELVWDEIVGFLWTMLGITPTLSNILMGFALFRCFDILKPWPVSWADQSIKGGWGIMLDDILAAMYAHLCLRMIGLL